MSSDKAERWLGLLAVVFASVLLFIWIPNDVTTGAIEKVRRSIVIGDSLAPILAGTVILLGGVLTLLRPQADASTLCLANVKWLAVLLVFIFISLVVIRHAGPLSTSLLEDAPYRALRDTVPWKYIGYLTGGSLLVFLLIAYASRSLRIRHLLIAIVAASVLALLYDLPFEDILLPPNGDV